VSFSIARSFQPLPGDQIIIPRAPDKTKDPSGYAAWEKQYGDCNGILEQVHLPGTYFSFSPFDYERRIEKMVQVNAGKLGVVIRKFGDPLPPGQVLADPAKNQRGPLPGVLSPGARHPEYSNPYAYEVKFVDPAVVEPGYAGVVTIMAGRPTTRPNDYLVSPGEQGVQMLPEGEGLRFVNPYERRITPVSLQSQRFEMAGAEAIRFPSSDSFEIKMEGFVEWAIIREKLPMTYVQYSEGAELIDLLEERVILPYSRSFSRLAGSQFSARDFISGDTKLKFQQRFEEEMRDKCEKQGIKILQALVRDIIPPDEIKVPINEREIAKQQIKTYQQQIQVAKSSADLATQTEMAVQNAALGDANKKVVTVVTRAKQDADVALTMAQQELAVAKLKLEAAQKQADAIVAKGTADANVILLNKQAEALPLRQQVLAFGDGDAYAQYFFYLKVAPAIKSILTNTDGPFADLFKGFTSNGKPEAVEKNTPVKPAVTTRDGGAQ
jgi:regulator of protease activity HflC (stomatin/prohibitin superfamily)